MTSGSNESASTADTATTASAEARAIAKEAYTYGFPMVDSYRIQHSYFVNRESPEFKAPWNQIRNMPRVFTPDDKAVQTPNSDTPYSMLGMDLRAEPIVLTVPAIEKERYYSIQLIDLYTHNFGYIGSRATGNDAGSYLIAGPGWKGETPEGVKNVIRSETELVLAAYRTQLLNPGDLENVKNVQAGYKAQPLSAFLGQSAPPVAEAIDFIKPLTPETQKTSLEFFNILNFVLQFCRTVPSETDLMARFAEIGVEAGKTLDAAKLSPEMKTAIEQGMADAWASFADLKKNQLDTGKVTSGDMFGTREYLKNNYLYRMAGAVIGIFANSKNEAMYPLYAVDARGQKLDGANRYTLRFAPGELPPVNSFWSLTMYELPSSLLVANPLNRYLINSPMLPQLKKDADGGLTLLIQNESPGVDKEANWLPAPKGRFFMALRLYWPREEAMEGRWTAPPLQAIKKGRGRTQRTQRELGSKNKSSAPPLKAAKRTGQDLIMNPKSTKKIITAKPLGAVAAVKTVAQAAGALPSKKSKAKKSSQGVGQRGHGNVPSEVQYRSTAERRAQGKALRDAVPRAKHSGWHPPKDRQDPVELVLAQNKGRLPDLVPIRHGRMMQSPFAFYRGSAAIMAADLAHTPNSGIRVQACGDAHLSNFGAFATPERNLVFDVNDLDETLPAPWEWDLKRLAASVVLAGRHIQLKQSQSAAAARTAVRSYREHMAEYSFMKALEVWYDRIDLERLMGHFKREKRLARFQQRVEQARGRSVAEHDFPKLAEHVGSTPRIKDNPPLIFHSDEVKAVAGSEELKAAWALYRESLPEHVRVLFDRYYLCDMANKVVGVGSVGTMCLIALYMAADDDPLFLQIKQANASVLEPYAGKSLHGNHGQRVVVGQRLMQAASDMFLGWSKGTGGVRDFYVRQLRDMKMSALIEGMDDVALEGYAEACGWALARAHARSGDPAMISGYMGSGGIFDEAICDFAVDYADQAELDYKAFVKAVREGRVKAVVES